jgi:hypothetical protein
MFEYVKYLEFMHVSTYWHTMHPRTSNVSQFGYQSKTNQSNLSTNK